MKPERAAAHARPAPARGLGTRDALTMAVLTLAVAAFHLQVGQGLATSVLLQSFNWVFDFDSSRYVGAWCTPGADLAQDVDLSFIARHALALAGRPLCLAVHAAGWPPAQALMAVTALCAGLNAALAYALAAAWCNAWLDRVLLALAHAVSAQALMLGVIPEVYGWAMAGVGLHMLLLSRAHGTPLGARGPAALSVFINTGVTVTNGGLNVVSSAVMSWRRSTLRQWLVGEVRLWLPALLALSLLTAALTLAYAPQLAGRAGEAPRQVWWTINMQRGEVAAGWEVVRALLLYSFVAPGLTDVPLPAPDLHAMVDFRAPRFGLVGGGALALWAGAALAAVGLAWHKHFQRRLLLVAAVWLVLNVLLHWSWQYRGSVWLYGAHSSFVLFTVLVMGYAGALARWRPGAVRAFAVTLLLLAAWHNIAVYRQMIEFLLAQPLTR